MPRDLTTCLFDAEGCRFQCFEFVAQVHCSFHPFLSVARYLLDVVVASACHTPRGSASPVHAPHHDTLRAPLPLFHSTRPVDPCRSSSLIWHSPLITTHTHTHTHIHPVCTSCMCHQHLIVQPNNRRRGFADPLTRTGVPAKCGCPLIPPPPLSFPTPCPSPGVGDRHLLNPKFFVAAHCVVVAKPPPKSASYRIPPGHRPTVIVHQISAECCLELAAVRRLSNVSWADGLRIRSNSGEGGEGQSVTPFSSFCLRKPSGEGAQAQAQFERVMQSPSAPQFSKPSLRKGLGPPCTRTPEHSGCLPQVLPPRPGGRAGQRRAPPHTPLLHRFPSRIHDLRRPVPPPEHFRPLPSQPCGTCLALGTPFLQPTPVHLIGHTHQHLDPLTSSTMFAGAWHKLMLVCGGVGGWHKASVSDCLPLAAPIGLPPLHILTLCGSELVLVVSTEPPDDLSCLTTPGFGCPRDGLLPVPLTKCIQRHTTSPCWVCRLQH